MQLLFDKTVSLTPKDNKTNFEIPLTIPQSIAALFIRTDYTPKKVADPELSQKCIREGMVRYVPESARNDIHWEDYLPVVNFVTFTLDYGSEYIGCAHRHAPSQKIIISESYSTPGFFRHAILPGEWKCVLNCHAVVDDTVAYRVQVFGVEEGEVLDDRL